MASQQQQQYPNLNPYASADSSNAQAQAQDVKNTVASNAQSTMDSIRTSDAVQQLQNGPMADKARQEVNVTRAQFGNLADSRSRPNAQTATGQKLTHYHSFFYNLLSWENPRATTISYVAIVAFIFATRYVPIIRYGLRLTWMTLGITAAAEVVGHLIMGQGFATRIRPKQYYTIPRESLEALLEDVTELINFFVIEAQRIVFAENVYATVTAFGTALLTYFLIKIMPTWGLGLFFTTVIYFVPLVYIRNKELIDHHLANAQDVVSQQTQQVRELASQHTNRAMEVSNKALKDYSAKAQEMIGSGKKQAVEKGYVSQETADKTIGKPEQAVPAAGVSGQDFPSAPKLDPTAAQSTTQPAAQPAL